MDIRDEMFLKTKNTFYPETLFTEVFGYKIIPVLEYEGEINLHTKLVYRWMYDKGSRPIKIGGIVAGYTPRENRPMVVLNQHMWMMFSNEIYLEFYHQNPGMREEVIHHAISVLV